PASDLVSFDRLEIVERYADRIDVLADVLDRMATQVGQDQTDDSAPVRVQFIARPVSGEGASNANSPQENSDEVWRRVGIAAIEPPANSDGSVSAALQLEFTSMGRLARAERLVTEIEPTVVAPILDRAIGRHSDPDVSGTLYELLIPHLLKGELNDGENLHLLVDRTTASYPWELLSARAEDANPQVPLALRVGVLRQFRESQQLRHDIRRAASDTILVVGNPPPGPGFNPLPGAAKEASAVETLFRSSLGKGWGVTSLVWSADGERVAGPDPVVDQEPGEEILHRLLNGDWRIVHMAAHGEVTDDEATTGVVVGGEFHLTAKVFASLSVVPDLVFLNSCHIGQIPNRDLKGMNRVAATVAESLLRIGVRAVIAAGWAVNDVAAEAFARSLYSALLSGRHLGEAVFDARRQAKAVAKESLTWGAYQCYGDPGFRLIARTVSTHYRTAQTAGELRRRIQRLGTTASDQGRTADADPLATKRSLARQISTLRVQALAMRSTGALADLAEVYAELGRFDWAAVLYRRALRRGGRDVPLRAVEQAGNMMIRWAHGRVRTQGATYADVRRRVDEAERWLHQAEAVGTTDERLSLLGGFHKRCATMTEGEDRERHLRLAVESYAKAQRLSDGAYQRNNWAQLYQVLTLLGVESDPEWLNEFSVTATVSDAGGPDDAPVMTLSAPLDPNQGAEQDSGELRWARFERGDRVLTAGVVTGTLDVDRLVRTYRGAFRLRSSARERASVID
ncbi:MAG TPA: CHAT domain-containing protein, partial [Acidimicrobiales bacterium]